MAVDTSSKDVINLLMKKWGLKSPNLIITVHGGAQNFALQPKIRRYLKCYKFLQKKTTKTKKSRCFLLAY